MLLEHIYGTAVAVGVTLSCMALAMPSMAKTPACSDTTDSWVSYWDLSPVDTDCTYAQLWASYRLSDIGEYWLLDNNTMATNAYRDYLNRAYEGYTPGDTELQAAEKSFKDAYVESGLYAKYTDELDNDPYEYLLARFGAPMLIGSEESRTSALNWVRQEFDDCQAAGGTCVWGAAQRLLGAGNSTKDSLYVTDEFRITNTNTEITSFGVWAQDSYWGFWQSEEYTGKRKVWELEGFSDSTAWASFQTRDTLFVAGGRNPTKPTTGTWNGLAVGRHKLLAEVRVGHSEVVVNLDAEKVDITITGLNFGGVSLSINEDEFDIATQLTWTGLDLSDEGSFHDPRTSGIRETLEDAFAAVLPESGEDYSETANTIRGQFYGENGDEVTGVFDKNHIEGSFGAYREATP